MQAAERAPTIKTFEGLLRIQLFDLWQGIFGFGLGNIENKIRRIFQTLRQFDRLRPSINADYFVALSMQRECEQCDVLLW